MGDSPFTLTLDGRKKAKPAVGVDPGQRPEAGGGLSAARRDAEEVPVTTVHRSPDARQ